MDPHDMSDQLEADIRTGINLTVRLLRAVAPTDSSTYKEILLAYTNDLMDLLKRDQSWY